MANSGAENGLRRAAILLRAIGEDHASKVLQYMGAKEVQAVSRAMVELESIPPDRVKYVLGNLQETIVGQTALGIGNDSYVQKVLEKAVGPEKAKSLLENVLDKSDNGIEELNLLDPDTVAELLQNEHPQIVALVLSSLDSTQSANVLTELPEALRSDVFMRIARLETVRPNALEQLKQTLVQRLKGQASSNFAKSRLGGAKCAADLLNELTPSQQDAMQEKIREIDEELGHTIEELMFVFENLIDIDDRGIQFLLREIEMEQLVVALKGSSTHIKEKIFKNMSRRAAELLKDDLEVKGPVRLSEVEEAQKAIITRARQLADEGSIIMSGRGGETYV